MIPDNKSASDAHAPEVADGCGDCDVGGGTPLVGDADLTSLMKAWRRPARTLHNFVPQSDLPMVIDSVFGALAAVAALSRTSDPAIGKFEDAVALGRYGDTPSGISSFATAGV